MMRNTTSSGSVCAIPQSAEPTPNSTRQTRYTRFCPKRRARNPVSGMTMTVAMTNPVVTQVICSTVTPSDPMRCGTATLTIDASIAPISVPNVIETVTSHLLTGGRSACTAGSVIVPAVIASFHGTQKAERRTQNLEKSRVFFAVYVLHFAFFIQVFLPRPLHQLANIPPPVLHVVL